MEKANFILENWEVIALVVTNILALFTKSPRQRKESKSNV